VNVTQPPLCCKKEEKMDILFTGLFAVFLACISLLIGIVAKKPIRKILIYVFLGFIIGLFLGYFLAPVIISFY
jgi:hypothetical protein